LTSNDVVYALQRFMTPATGAQQASRLDAIQNGAAVRLGKVRPELLGVGAQSARTVVMELEYPDIELPTMLSLAYIVPPHVIAAHGSAWSRPEHIVSNGAYRLDRWAAGAKTLYLRKNPHHYDAAKVAIEQIEWHTGYDDATRLRMFRAGEADIAMIEDSASLALARRDFASELRSSPEFVAGAIGFNLKRKPFDNPAVRQALAMSLDRRALAEKIRGMGESPSESFLPPGLPNYPQRAEPMHAAWSMAQRVARARELLASVGFGPGKPLKFAVGYPAAAIGRKVYLAVMAMWKAVGVELTLQPLEGRAYNAALQRGDFDTFSFNNFAAVPSPLVFLERFQGDSALNVTFYRSADFDRTLAAGARAVDAAARARQFLAAERVLLRDYPAIPLFSGASNRLVHRRVANWQNHPVHAHPSQYLTLANA
jgi:oligopeptide transport system substrate-binding protein